MLPASISDYRELARRRLPRMIFDYIDGGSYAEVTLARNVADMEAIALRQRVMKDMSRLSTAVTLFGEPMAMPLALAPVGMAGMYGRRGEVQAARAAKAAGVPFCLSTVGICPLEEVGQGAGTPPWFQLYMLKDRGYMRELLARAKDVGSRVLVFTVDLPVPGTRYRDVRSGLSSRAAGPGANVNRVWQGLTRPGWLWDVYLNGRPHVFGNVAKAVPQAKGFNDFWGWIGANFDRTVAWKEIDWVRESWDGPVVLKGVLDVEDAREAVRAGADGIVVSNHGGRQLDGVKSSIAALPRIADAVGGDLTVLMDGGVRSGLDILKALALGAKGVMIGRAWAYALGAGGQPMIERMLGTLRAELATAMILTGCTDVQHADKTLLDAAV
ncbi:L-lactate dehydrogenase [Phenylobacterium terrae]|uniref:L-lactate dehydrogenase n=1 Tax=Phenylobacterium terrae TaxID=2665495 RepID=A0ABW4MVI9_9CAUL